jgi:hypothetical protein
MHCALAQYTLAGAVEVLLVETASDAHIAELRTCWKLPGDWATRASPQVVAQAHQLLGNKMLGNDRFRVGSLEPIIVSEGAAHRLHR